MERSNLKDPDDPVESWLRSQAALPPLPDEGFSLRVLAALPPRRRPSPWPRRVVCLAGAATGTVVAAAHAFGTESRPIAAPWISRVGDLSGWEWPIALMAIAGLLAMAFWQTFRDGMRV